MPYKLFYLCAFTGVETDKDYIRLKLLGKLYERAKLAGNNELAIRLEKVFDEWHRSPSRMPVGPLVVRGRNHIRTLRGLDSLGV